MTDMDMSQYLGAFLDEADDNLQRLDDLLLARFSSFSFSPSTSRVTGMPVQRLTISAISSSVTSSRKFRMPV